MAKLALHDKVALALTKYTPEQVIEATMTQLRANADDIIARMLGMEKRWNSEWEVDHCNGRMSNITSYVNSIAKVHVDQFLRENLTPERMGVIVTPAMINTICKNAAVEYKRKLEYAVFKELDNLASKHAAEIVKEMSDEFRKQCSTGEVTDR